MGASANAGPVCAWASKSRADGLAPKSIETPSSGFYPVGVAAVTRLPASLGLIPASWLVEPESGGTLGALSKVQDKMYQPNGG